MRRITLNFAASGRRRAAVIVGVGVVLAMAAVMERQRAAMAELQSWQRKSQAMSASTERRILTGGAQLRLEQEVARANRVVDRLGLPWGAVLSAVDITMVEDVTLLSMEPDADRRDLRIAGEARSRKAILNYVRALQRSSLFTDSHITSDQVNLQDPQRPIRFVLEAQWANLSSARPDMSAGSDSK